MTNIFQDLASNAIVTAGNAYGTAISATGGLTAVDLADAVANRASALLACHAVSGSGIFTIKIQESDTTTDGDFTDVINAQTAAAYTFAVSDTANVTQLISFNTNKRYVRGYATKTSGTSVSVVLVFVADRRVTPTGQGGWVNEAGPN